MAYRTRINYTAQQKSEMWDRWEKGESLKSIGRLFDRPSSCIFNVLAPTGGIRPPIRKRSKRVLTLSEREEISRGIVAAQSLRQIATSLNRAPSTISREIRRNGGYHCYRATQAEQAAWDRAKRPKRCKLVCHRLLSQIVAKKLRAQWSPQQIAGWLKRKYPEDENSHVSHETIYKTLFIQSRGALKKELLQHLRTKRAIRRSKHSSLKGQGLGKIPNAVSISDRDEDESDDLIGMGDIDAGLDAGIYAMGRLGPLTARVNFRRDLFDNYDGSLVSVRLGYGFSVARKARVILNVGTTYADENFMSTYFSVTDTQSSGSGLPIFKADSGIKDVSVGANLIYPFYKNWTLLTFASYSRLLNDTADSPLVSIVGSENQFRMAFGIGYRFQFFGDKKNSGKPQ